MWGLDATDPRIAIAAMNAMNGSVRNIVFAPIFFGTPFVLVIAAAFARAQNARRSAIFFASAAILYALGGIALTVSINVPMNRELLQITPPADIAEAAKIWAAYSETWQFWNIMRTIVSGLTLLLAALGLAAIPSKNPI